MSENSKGNIAGWFGIIMSTLFIAGAIGIALGYTDEWQLIRERRLLFAIPVLLYGLLRFYRAVRTLQGKDMFN
jgi:hypothetical protein